MPRDAAYRLAELSEEHDYPLWRALASVLESVAVTAMGDAERGVRMLETSVTIYQGLAPPPVFWPLVLGVQAAVYAMGGNPQKSLELVEEAIGIMSEEPPELLVARGDMLQIVHGPHEPGVRESYDAAVAQAQNYGLKTPELMAQTRLVQLNRQLGVANDAAGELAALLETFTEGHDAMVLVEARQALAS